MSGEFAVCRESSQSVGRVHSLSAEFTDCWQSSQSIGRVRILSGELGLPQHPSTMATTFSKTTSLVGLQELPGGWTFTTRTKQITLPSAEFTDAVFGGGSDVQRVTEHYEKLLLPGLTPLSNSKVPQALQDIFAHISTPDGTSSSATALGRFSYSSS